MPEKPIHQNCCPPLYFELVAYRMVPAPACSDSAEQGRGTLKQRNANGSVSTKELLLTRKDKVLRTDLTNLPEVKKEEHHRLSIILVT